MITHTRTEIQGHSKATWSVSTLLIPERYRNYYQDQCQKHGSRARYLRYLLSAYGPLVKHYQKRMMNQKNDKWKNHYQKSGQELKKANFRPAPEIWEQLRNIATGFGVSMCYLFIFLMELEMHKLSPCVFELSNTEFDSLDDEWSRWIQHMELLAANNRWSTNLFSEFAYNITYFCSRQVDFGPMKLHRHLKLST